MEWVGTRTDGSITVLHVDDEPNLVRLMADVLERKSDRFDVRSTTRPSVALEMIEEVEPDCVVSDFEMPEMDGIELLQVVRERHGRLPFILFTGRGSEEIASEAITLGVTDYVQKGGGTSQYEVLSNRIINATEHHRSRLEADRTRRLLSDLAESADDILYLFTGDWNELLFVNSAYERIWGHSREDLRENPDRFLEFVHPEDRKRVLESMERLSGGEPSTLEYRVVTDSGERRRVRGVSKPIFDGDGDVVRIAGVVRDITETGAVV